MNPPLWPRSRRAGVAAATLFAVLASLTASAGRAATDASGIDWLPVGRLLVARTETTIGQFRRFAQATGFVSRAERDGGGEVYEGGWVRKPGWTWRAPFGSGRTVRDDEPAVHVTWHEAQAFCRWADARLPTDPEWVDAAYREQRLAPPIPLETGRTYPFPHGQRAEGAQCLDECGPAAAQRAVAHDAGLLRGAGHARVGQTPAGVNGLHDMGGNAWEWIDEPRGATGNAERRTRGGSWWYGQAQMRADYLQGKPADTAVVYIGFRCVRDIGPGAPDRIKSDPRSTPDQVKP